MRGVGRLMVREVGRVSGDWSGDYLRREREDWEESSEGFHSERRSFRWDDNYPSAFGAHDSS
jgi:hypothetical protein